MDDNASVTTRIDIDPWFVDQLKQKIDIAKPSPSPLQFDL